MSIQVRYTDIPTGSNEDAVAKGESQPFGNAAQIISGCPDTPWATLEPSGWSLDGSAQLFEKAPAYIGWWSETRSEADGRFSEPPVLSVLFSEPFTASGLTFTFWPSMNHWCSEMHLQWFNGETLLAEKTAYPDSPNWVLSYTVEGFDRIEIEFLATNIPGQFAKMQQLQVGQVIVFLQDELTRVSVFNEIDPSLCEMTVDTMTVEIRDKKNRNLIPQKNQQMQLFRDGVQIATQYITESERESRNGYRFQCQSAIGLLEDDFLGGFCETVPASELLADILGDMPFVLDPEFAQAELTGYLPVCTRREALQQVSFAMGAAVTTQGDGTIRLNPIANTVTGSFGAGEIFAGAKLTQKPRLAGIRLTAHSYVPDEETVTLLNQEQVSGLRVLYVFSEPYHDYVITGGTLDSYGDNWVRITPTGPVTLTGQKYLHTKTPFTWDNPGATAMEKGNVLTVENATLVNPNNAYSALSRLITYGEYRNTLTQNAVVNGKRTGDLVESPNPWGTVTRGYITAMESEFTATGHTANITVQGKEVPKE